MSLAAPSLSLGASASHHPPAAIAPTPFAFRPAPSLRHLPPSKRRQGSASAGRAPEPEPRSGTALPCAPSLGKLSDAEALPLPRAGTGLLPDLPGSPGVYAIYDKLGQLQFIGLSRKLSSSIHSHVRDLPHLCGSVKVAVSTAVDRASLVSAWKQWMEEYIQFAGKAPPGNMSGVTAWTVGRERQVKPDLRLTPGRNKELTITLGELIDKVVKEHKVVAFIKGSRSAPACGFSHRVLTALNEHGADYETVNVLDEEHNAGVKQALKAYSNWPTFPQVYIHGGFVGGADIIDQMVQNGSLKTVLEQQVKIA